MTVVMMERSEDGEREIWGTWEDLLLAFAVLRHGAEDWDTVARELGRRTRTAQARVTVTSQDCKNRYHGLRRRFEGVVQPEIEEVGDSSWMEELRQLRVAELRREVQRIDVSIGSLESKLKTLTTEEREEEGHAAGNGPAVPGENREKSCDESPAAPPVDVAGDHASGNRPGRWSCDESTSPRRDLTPVNGGGRVEPVDKPRMNPDPESGGDEKGPSEGSCNGSSDTIAKARNTVEGEEAKTPRAPPESGESREAARENSDVQSSASLSKKRRGRRSKASVSGGSSVGDEADVVSPSERREEGDNKSRPLAGFLEIIRMNGDGSVFERRLEIQESTRYRSMIREHMDLGMIGSRLDGSLPYTAAEFFRDLLLLCNNAIVFFPKDSSQHVAAARLRDLVNREIEATNAGHNKPNASEFPMAPPPSQPARMKSESDAENSVPGKRSTTPTLLLACRRRNGYPSAKAATVAAAEEAVVGKKEADEEKVVENLEDKRKKELPAARGLRTTKARAAVTKKNGVGVEVSNPKPNPGDEQSKTKERSNNDCGGNNAKKRSAASFLDRLKKGGLSTPKNSSGGRGGGSNEQKKGGRGEGKKDPGGDRPVSSRQARENSTPVKRSVGRPPKRPPAKRARPTERDVSPPPPPSRGSGRKKAKR